MAIRTGGAMETRNGLATQTVVYFIKSATGGFGFELGMETRVGSGTAAESGRGVKMDKRP